MNNEKKTNNKNDYNTMNNSSELQNIDDVYNEQMKNDAKAAALVGPLGGMVGGPIGGLNNLAAVVALNEYGSKLINEEDEKQKD